MKISLIVAKAENNVIGRDNQLIWKLSDDLKLFKKHTTGHHIIMGRKTYESMGKPLPNRTSIVISRNNNYEVPAGHHVVNSLESAIQLCIGKHLDQVYIIGGAQIYKEAIGICDEMLITEVEANPQGDAFFPEFNKKEWKEVYDEEHRKDEKNEFDFKFVIYKRMHTKVK
ncbi:dihydrofolate reductase [Belliella kenyensis]|uniref:Dihydrofolate reductase n=1 Tax=Belliella kenyensis TaxID=1472724 RepID=A0ABV8ETK3_9BACT|nr:dihydrofolate reductase [Belliella kenyensis]MCH7402155.1 dihydrofolate reductase [Belliella kenyensis]MDN3601670.1 dihydrofolate reductase [Belliella kenyensis]